MTPFPELPTRRGTCVLEEDVADLITETGLYLANYDADISLFRQLTTTSTNTPPPLSPPQQTPPPLSPHLNKHLLLYHHLNKHLLLYHHLNRHLLLYHHLNRHLLLYHHLNKHLLIYYFLSSLYWIVNKC